MKLDILLSSALFLTTVAVLFLYIRFEKRVRPIFEERKLRYPHVILLVVVMSTIVTALIFLSGEALTVLSLSSYSIILFLFMYVVVPKWYVAVLGPTMFIVLYLFCWNIYFLNLFAIFFAIIVSVFIGSLFTWKTTAVFAALITLMDVVQVLGTRFMEAYSQRMLELWLPAMIILPTFPSQGITILGVGDLFLSGLLSIQTAQKYGKKFGFTSIVAIALVFLLLETILINYYPRGFPATVLVISGWATALGARYLYNSRILRHA